MKTALKANAIFSGLSGLTMTLFSKSLAELMNITLPWILPAIGIGLLLFCGFLIQTIRRKPLDLNQVKIITWMDWAWVGGSLVLILTQALGLSVIAYWIIGIVAAIISIFATGQRSV